jgi:hypothetical protein
VSDAETAEIPFYASEDRSSDPITGSMPLSVNVIADQSNALPVRPGTSAWSQWPSTATSGSPVIGMTAWRNFLVWVQADRKIRAMPIGGQVMELSNDEEDTLLDGSLRPSFVPGRNMLVIAGGGAMQKWAGTGISERLTNTGAGGDPPDTNQVVAVAQRLIAAVNGQSGQLWWSGPLEEYENWDMSTGGSSYIQAAAKPDPIIALTDNTNEVFAWGQYTLQVFAPANLAVDANDANNLLDFAPSRTANIGITARDSICPVDDTFIALDRIRRIVITDGRTYSDISTQVAKLLRDFEVVDDCWSFRMRYSKWDCVVFIFPTAGRGLIFNAKSSRWSEWIYSVNGDIPNPIPITSAFHWSEQNVFLVGMEDGSIATLDDEATTDLGAPIMVELVSGFQTHGTTQQKACKTIMLAYRAEAVGGAARLWRRDGLGAWTLTKQIDITSTIPTNKQLRSIGVYRQRQWKMRYFASDKFRLISVFEEFEPLGA